MESAGLPMSNDADAQWAKTWAAYLDQSPSVQHHMSNPESMESIRKYADSLRMRLPDVSDTDLGKMLVWVSDFMARAQDKYGADIPIGSIVMSLSVTAREIMKIDIDL